MNVTRFFENWKGLLIPHTFTLDDLVGYWSKRTLSTLTPALQRVLARNIVRRVKKQPRFESWYLRQELVSKLMVIDAMCSDNEAHQLLDDCIKNLPPPEDEQPKESNAPLMFPELELML